MTISFSTPSPGITVLQIDRPQVRNAMDWESMVSFREHIEQAYSLPDLQALIVTGSDGVFIAGGDLKELSRFKSTSDGQRLTSLMTTALQRLEGLPCPTIAAMNGPARGGGAEISLACDFRVMAEDADLGFVQIRLGLTPGWGAGQRLLRLVGYNRAFEWLVTGKIIRAQEAHSHGVANRLAPPGEALPVSLDLAREIASQPIQVSRALKRLLRASQLLPASTAAYFEQAEFPSLWSGGAHLQAVDKFLGRT